MRGSQGDGKVWSGAREGVKGDDVEQIKALSAQGAEGALPSQGREQGYGLR